MSGGVDSSVAAVLLVEQGYEVIGAFMKNWDDCEWRADKRDAMRVAAQLGIDFISFDFEDEYRKNVYEYMIAEYVAGRTPNPDVLCNKYMKFGFLMREAEKLNCEFVATGHYARVVRNLPPDMGGSEGGNSEVVHLMRGLDNNKDQSYFLCQLTQDQLKKVMFPIGEIEKPKVREIARQHNLVVADKKDSQGICFVGKVDLIDFLKERIPEQVGDIITTDGEVIGEHKGQAYYTIGQRQGLGIGGGVPYFIVERDAKNNRLIVAKGDDDDRLYSLELTAVEMTETVEGNLKKYEGKNIKCRIRYRQPLQNCQYQIDGDKVTVNFEEKQRAVAPGQFIAFYVGDELIGSAVISNSH